MPLDPAAAGIASLLKSLKTRAGLREDRLSETELPLDALMELPAVRAAREQGELPQLSIIRAVRGAVGSLPPTLSIVADVALCLGMLGDAVPDELYSTELGLRRDALLKYWDLLHQRRSVTPVPRRPRPRNLRLVLEAEALAELARVLTGSAADGAVSRADSAEPGKIGEPATGDKKGRQPRGRQGADRMEPAEMSLIELTAGTVASLYQAYGDIAQALRGQLLLDDIDQPTGWRHNLRRTKGPPTPWATAYGLRAMILLEEHLAPDLAPLVQRLHNVLDGGAGWHPTAMHYATRPETTATVIDALHAAEGTAELAAEFEALEQEFGEFERGRPYILATALESAVRVRPRSPLVDDLVRQLLVSRSEYGQYLLWPEKVLDSGRAPPAASPVHTARAVRALSVVQSVQPAKEISDAIELAATWLAVDNSSLVNVSELIDRPLPDGSYETQYLRHFTAAWVVKALISVGLPASHPAVSAAIASIWQSYSETIALWMWANGDIPVWMSYDAIDALRLASLATLSRPAVPAFDG